MSDNENLSGFPVNAVAIEGLPEGMEGILVAIAEDHTKVDNVLILSRSFRPSDQDRRLKQDTYCLSLPAGPTAYGGVLKCGITDGALRLTLNHSTAEKLGIPEKCDFPLNVDNATIVRLATALKTAFAAEDGGLPELDL